MANKQNNEGVICHCSGTTRAQIIYFAEKTRADLASISRATGACTGCASCEDKVLELLKDYLPTK
ncbi:MAG: (2Fe-2S)-binding protein [Methylococcaceae bacterium]|jgi:NAD(P)H-nitrite reductase large subunit